MPRTYHAAKSGLTLLPIEVAHTLLAARLPCHHRDPFDRILIAQAVVENLVFVTVDPRSQPTPFRFSLDDKRNG